MFTNRLSWKNVLEHVKNKDKNFLAVGKGALDDANSKSFPWAWNCSPVSKSTLDRSFEFVVTKKSALESDKQDYSYFKTYIDNSSNQYVCNFPNLRGDATLIVPIPVSGLNFNNISRFTKNASLKQQENFWEGVASRVSKELNKDGKTIWLNTHGTGVNYLHVRIDNSPKYYFFEDYKNPNYTPIPTPRTPKEKLLANLDKLCFDPKGHLANNEHLKSDGAEEEYQKYYSRGLDQWKNRYLKIVIEGEEIDLENFNNASSDFFEVKRELIKKIKQEIDKNPQEWEIKRGKEENYSVESFNRLIRNKKSGRQYWKIGFLTMNEPSQENYWTEIETALNNSPKKLETDKKWYNPLDYPLPWTITLAFSALLIVITMTFWKRTKKRF